MLRSKGINPCMKTVKPRPYPFLGGKIGRLGPIKGVLINYQGITAGYLGSTPFKAYHPI